MTVVCDLHGPMRWREGPGWWECLGFDGEGPRECGLMLLYEEDIERSLHGPSPHDIPGVTIAPWAR